jgi:hypothetical protein
MALKDDVMNEYFEKKKDLGLSNKGGSKVRLFDEPGVNREDESENRKGEQGTNLNSKLDSKLNTKLEINPVRRRVYDLNKTGFLASSGFRRRLLIALYGYCCASRNLQTPRLSIENIAKSCNALVNTAKKTLQRLEKDGFIKRVMYKAGRSGWTVYALDRSVHQEIGVQWEVIRSV